MKNEKKILKSSPTLQYSIRGQTLDLHYKTVL